MLIDTGVPGKAETILFDAVAALGKPAVSIRNIVLTQRTPTSLKASHPCEGHRRSDMDAFGLRTVRQARVPADGAEARSDLLRQAGRQRQRPEPSQANRPKPRQQHGPAAGDDPGCSLRHELSRIAGPLCHRCRIPTVAWRGPPSWGFFRAPGVPMDGCGPVGGKDWSCLRVVSFEVISAIRRIPPHTGPSASGQFVRRCRGAVSRLATSAAREIKMGYSEHDPAARNRRPWNTGRIVGAKRALKPKQVWAIRFWLHHEGRLRDRALFDFAIDSKLRGCDVVKVRITDIVSGGQIRTRAIVVQQKTGRPVQFELLDAARTSMLAWLKHRGGALEDHVFPSRANHAVHLSTRQYARLVDEWVTGIGLRKEEYGTHSLRRTKASIIYKATGNLRAVQILLGHTKIESTVRYLGVDVEDALHLSECTDV